VVVRVVIRPEDWLALGEVVGYYSESLAEHAREVPVSKRIDESQARAIAQGVLASTGKSAEPFKVASAAIESIPGGKPGSGAWVVTLRREENKDNFGAGFARVGLDAKTGDVFSLEMDFGESPLRRGGVSISLAYCIGLASLGSLAIVALLLRHTRRRREHAIHEGSPRTV